MVVLGWVWLVSPFAVIAVISHDQRLLALVALHHGRCLAIGWTGVTLMLLGATIVPGAIGSVMFCLGTPLAGLAVWLRRDGWDDGGTDEPDVPPFDWGDFERAFWAHVRRGGSRPPRPRTRSAA
jgi:hypothetical protein